MTLFAWKFLVPSDRWYPHPDDDRNLYKGIVAVAVAADSSTARTALEKHLTDDGTDASWLAVAKVYQIPLVDGAVLAFAEV
ncbi:MAG: hypothetical protein ABIE42_09105 [Candidatus Eisenbacteria bacterium]